ncbi:VWA domain-containing protein [Nocardia sp. NPDC059177]|uniref:vWA domain-containing protein n=1 Tax=Nocardia sp. NPDC059177 TaxID=3346759 RepID=UPI0036C1113C
MTAPAPHGLGGHVAGFVAALRARGIPVGPSETIDAGRVLTVLDLLDREAVREGLACAVLRKPTHRATFDGLFDLWFPVAVGDRGADSPDLPRTPDGQIDVPALRELLAELLADENAGAQLEALAGQVVEQLGQYQSARGPSFSAYQAMKDLAPQTLLSRVLAGLALPPDASARDTEVAQRIARERIAGFRASVQAETNRRVAEQIGRDRVATYGVARQAEDTDFLRASERELAELKRSTQRLARILASRLAVRRKRSRRGEIDLRKTLRASMSTGGVPIDLVNRKPRPGRPELVLLCDISGSVAGFSNFTLLLVSALREQFSRVRIFAFVDRTDEVTSYFDPHAGLDDVLTRIFTQSHIIDADGHSDYGQALSSFADHFADAVTSRSSLLILGDGRTNYRNPRLDTLRDLAGAARHAHWLNPEPKNLWGTGDSAAREYSAVIEMHECRSARQLTDVVSRLLPV